MPSFKMKFSGVTILQGVEFSIFPIDFEWALQQCSATALPVMYADDTKFGREVTSSTENENLQADLDCIQQWFEKWQIRFNDSKCKTMHLGHINKYRDYIMKVQNAEVVLEPVSTEKDLGAWTDDKLKCSSHIGHVVSKANQVLGLIKRYFVYRNIDIVKRLFTTLVRPHLKYANVVAHPRFKKAIGQLEKVQRRVTKLVTVCKICHMNSA